MIRTTLVLAMGLATALPALSTALAEEAEIEAKIEAKIEISDEEALEDDILLMIDLPIVVADARDAGVDEEELDAVLTTVSEAGVGAAVTAELVLAEIETTKTKGHRKGLHLFVRRELVKGEKPRDIAKKVRDREEILDDMTDEEREALDKRVNELRDYNMRHRKARHEKRKELVNHGQMVKLIAHEAHEQRKAELMERKSELEEARREHKAAKKDLKAEKKDHHDAKKDLHDAKKDLKAAETPEEKREAAHDLKDAKKDLHEEKKDHHDAKKDLKDAKKDHKKAADDVKAKDKKKGPPPPGKAGKAGKPGGKKKGG